MAREARCCMSEATDWLRFAKEDLQVADPLSGCAARHFAGRVTRRYRCTRGPGSSEAGVRGNGGRVDAPTPTRRG
jgi:hypothetical protein